MENRQAGDVVDRGLTYGVVEMGTAVAFFLLGAVMMYDSFRIGAGWAFDGPESGYFPFRTGAIISIASLVIFIRTMLNKTLNSKVFVTWERFKQVLMVLAPTAVYVLITQAVGIYVASTLFIIAFMRMEGDFTWLKTVVVSVGVSAALFWMFEIQFKMPLPKGPLEALFGF
jgi:hypothetical protein